MTATYPGAVKDFGADVVANVTTIAAAHINALREEVEAIEAAMGIRPNVVTKMVFKTGIPDNTATTVFTITTTNETGSNDGGVYAVKLHGVVAHGSDSASAETSCKSFGAQFCRAINAAGSGMNSAVTENLETASAASTSATKDLTTVTMTLVETSEYVTSVQILVDCTGTTVTTADVYFEVELVYIGFLTAPVIASA